MRRRPLKRKTPLRRGDPPKRYTRINPVSAKRRAANRVRRTATRDAVQERSGDRCEARINEVCTGRAEDMHEVLSRARGGPITDPDNCLAVCRPCHEWVTAHPREAVERGLLRWSWEGD